jgi:hypothetical protein
VTPLGILELAQVGESGIGDVLRDGHIVTRLYGLLWQHEALRPAARSRLSASLEHVPRGDAAAGVTSLEGAVRA